MMLHRSLSFSAIALSIVFLGCAPEIDGKAPNDLDNTYSEPNNIPSTMSSSESGQEAEVNKECKPPSVFKEPKALVTPLPEYRIVREGCDKFRPPVVQFLVEKDGSTKKHELIRGTGCEKSDEIVLNALKNWRYEPATCDGEPITQQVIITIRWGN